MVLSQYELRRHPLQVPRTERSIRHHPCRSYSMGAVCYSAQMKNVPKWFVALWKHYVGLDPYRCYLTDERPPIAGPSKVIRVSMTVDIEVPEDFNTSQANMGIARSVVMENFKTCESALIQTWHISGAETIRSAKPRRNECRICGAPWRMKDCRQV